MTCFFIRMIKLLARFSITKIFKKSAFNILSIFFYNMNCSDLSLSSFSLNFFLNSRPLKIRNFQKKLAKKLTRNMKLFGQHWYSRFLLKKECNLTVLHSQHFTRWRPSCHSDHTEMILWGLMLTDRITDHLEMNHIHDRDSCFIIGSAVCHTRISFLTEPEQVFRSKTFIIDILWQF